MLQKSKRSALIFSAVVVLCFTLVTALLRIALPYWRSGDLTTIVSNPEILSQPRLIGGLAIFALSFLLIQILIGWWWLHKFFGDDYFGRRGAIHWALFGVLLAALLALPDLLPGSQWEFVRLLFRYASPFPAFFLARWISGVKRNRIS